MRDKLRLAAIISILTLPLLCSVAGKARSQIPEEPTRSGHQARPLDRDAVRSILVRGLLMLRTPSESLREMPGDEYEAVLLAESAASLGLGLESLLREVQAWADSAETPFDRGLAELFRRDYEAAAAALTQSLSQAEPPTPERHMALATALHELKRHSEALEQLERARSLRPDDPTIVGNLGIVRFALFETVSPKDLGQATTARALLLEALELRDRSPAPDSDELFDNLLTLVDVLTALIDATSGDERARFEQERERIRRRLYGLIPPAPTPSLTTSNEWALRYNFGPAVIPELPLEGVRSFDRLVLLAPGVSRVPFTSGSGPAVGIGVGTAGQFSVNGQRGRSNNFTIDGSDNNDEDIGVRRQGFVSLSPQGIDSVLELQVVTAGPPSQFGRNSGSVVNMISRRGQTDFHGSLFGLFSDDFLNARDFFETSFVDRVNQGASNGGDFESPSYSEFHEGGTAGGRLLSDRLFFFASVEQHRFRRNEIRHFVLPRPDERGLRGYDQTAGFILTPVSELDERLERFRYRGLAGREIYGLIPFPNNPAGPFGGNTYSQVRQGRRTGTVATGQLEYYLTPENVLTGRYNFTDDRSLIPFTGEALNSAIDAATRTQNLSLYLNTRWGAAANLLRFSYGRTALGFPPEMGSPLIFGSPLSGEFLEAVSSSPNFLVPTEPIRTEYGVFGPFGATGPIGQLWVDPFSPIGVDVFNFPQGRVNNTFQFADAVTMSFDRHLLKFGVDVRRSHLNSFADRLARPLVRFGYGMVGDCANPCPLATPDGLLRGTDTAALGVAAGFLQSLSTGQTPDTTIGLRLTQWDLFAQDEWRVAPRFTLNLGLRWEYQTPPREQNRRIEDTFQISPDQFSRLDDEDAEVFNRAFDRALEGWLDFLGGRTRIYDPFRWGFSPRVGFAWDPTGGGRWAVRGGFALLYDANLGAVTSQSRNVFPTFVPVNLDPAFLPPNGVILNTPVFLRFNVGVIDRPLIRSGTLNSFNLDEAFATAVGALFRQMSLFGIASSNGLAFTLPERRFRPPYALQSAFSVQKRLGDNLLFTASYVGSQGRRLTGFSTPNAGFLSTPFLFDVGLSQAELFVTSRAPSIPPGGEQRPDSRLGAYTVFGNAFSSSYHSLQFFLQSRGWKGLQAQVQWTWSKAIDQVSDPFDGRGFFALSQDQLRPDQERAPASFDVRHRVAGYFTWESPAGGSGHWLRRLAERWRFSGIVELQTGQPFTVNTVLDRNGDGNLTDRLDTTEGIRLHPGRANSIDPGDTDPEDLLAPMEQNGRVGRNTFRADGLALVNLAVSKGIALAGERELRFRVEIFNALNNVSYGIPIRILESPGFGTSYDSQSRARSIRFSVKWLF